METLVLVELPWPRVTLVEGESVKVGAAIVSVSVVEAVRVPEVPVMVTVEDPMAAVLLAVKVTVELLVVGLMENEAVTPAGKLVAPSVTLPVNPFCGST